LTSSSERAPRPVSLSNMPESFSERLSNIASLQTVSHQTRATPIAPGGATRCRAGTAALKGRSAYRRGEA
jgi:hypothetical protein